MTGLKTDNSNKRHETNHVISHPLAAGQISCQAASLISDLSSCWPAQLWWVVSKRKSGVVIKTLTCFMGIVV